ncbi:hypothetical protein [Streptomyces wuyuanensis]|uniref:Uncharacterized protein n=1 Tax=Streptomyces wuyuanensis TaxID=1196353 RepID=A0A1G9ZAF8_9ACTN|nr:hypothetical protein [Streptomyces wuyuanensis]SDN18390.1 hypothetical protein SAMN05444921_12154 [Streptomyces wuyuanensis]
MTDTPAPVPSPAGVRDQIAEALWPLTDWNGDRLNAEAAADAVLRVPVIAEALGTVSRVRAECDRIEAAVRANPKHPDFDGAYLAAIGHIRRALNPLKETT